MIYAMVHQPGSNNAQSPFRVIVHKTGRQVDWINRYLDQSCVRGLARHTLRSYALDLLHFVRWWADLRKTDDVTEQALTGSTLLDYVRFQAGQEPRPAADTINRRVWVVSVLCAICFPMRLLRLHRAFSISTGDDPH
jgi:Phage integrase, N-terminal SAM-like domain